MLRFSLAAGAFALSLAMPALAQTPAPAQSTTPAPTQPASPAMSSPDATAMTCDQMMSKAGTMSTSASGARMAMEQKEMNMARQAKAKNDEAGCKAHMEKAMKLMR